MESKPLNRSYTLCLNMVEVELKKWGNSIGIILPAEKLKELNLRGGDKAELNLIKKEYINGFGICKGSKSFKEDKEGHRTFW